MAASTVYRRLFKTLTALVLGTGQEVVYQLLSVLLWITFWGVDLASEWIMVSLAPMLLMRGNAGLFHTATSDLIAAVTRQDDMAVARTRRALVIAQRVALAVITAMYVLAALALAALDSLQHLADTELAMIAGLFAVQFALFQWQQATLAIAKAAAEPAVAILWQNGFRCVFIVIMLSATLVAGPVLCLAAAVLGQCAVWLATQRFYNRLRKTYPAADREGSAPAARRLLVQGLQFSAFPFGQTAMHNASVWALGAATSPVTAAAFHAMRTLSRLLVLASRAFEQAVRLELSRLFADQEIVAARDLLRRSLVGVSMVAILLCAVLVLLGPQIFQWQTRGALVFDADAFLLLAVSGLVFAIAQVFFASLFAVNRLDRVTWRFVLLTTAAVACAAVLAPLGAVALAAVTLALEILVLLLARQEMQGLLKAAPELANRAV